MLADTVYFDEAHNAVQKNFVEAVEHHSMYALRNYFFTATPKHSFTPFKIGMNDSDIFGGVICNVGTLSWLDRDIFYHPK